MERSTPVRKPHTSTADLLVWSETPPSDSPAQASATRPSRTQVGAFSFFNVLIVFDFQKFVWLLPPFPDWLFTSCNGRRLMGSARWCSGVR